MNILRFLAVTESRTEAVSVNCQGWLNMGPSLWTMLSMIQHGVETSNIQRQKYANPMALQAKWHCSYFQTVMCQYWNVALNKVCCYCCTVHWNQSWSQQYATSTEDWCPRGFPCSTKTCVHIPWQLLFKQSGHWNLTFSHIPHIGCT